jgi:hypothetical protein
MKRCRVWLAAVLGLLFGLMSLFACQSAPETTTARAASVQPPAGWLKYTGGGVEIYLPPYFDWDLKDPTTASSLQLLGVGPVLQQLTAHGEAIAVFDSGSITQTHMPSFMTATPGSPGPPGLLLEEYVSKLKYGVVGGKLTSRSDLIIDGRPATRLVIEGDELSFVAFVVTGPAGYWIVQYAVPTSELQSKLADLDSSAATFHILR